MNDNEKNPSSQAIVVGGGKNTPGIIKSLSAAMAGAAGIRAVAASSYASYDNFRLENRIVHPYNPGSARIHMKNRRKRKIANKSKRTNRSK